MTALPARTTARRLDRQRRTAAVLRVAARAGVYVLAGCAGLVCAAPFLYALVTAVTRPTAAGRRFAAPGPLPHFSGFVENTLVTGGLVVVITLALALPAAYALARLNRWWAAPARVAVLLVFLVPPALLLPSLSRLAVALGLAGSPWSLMLVYPALTIPVAVWLLAGVMAGVPRQVEEQAMVDGYGRLGAFARVVVPLTLPGLAAVAVMVFTLAAGEFSYALTLVSSAGRMPLSTGPVRDPLRRSAVMGTVVVVALPIAALVGLCLERYVTVIGRASTPGRSRFQAALLRQGADRT